MMGIPSALTWAGVLTSVGDLLGNALVLAAITVALALAFGPQIMQAVFNATGIQASRDAQWEANKAAKNAYLVEEFHRTHPEWSWLADEDEDE